jgi:hypothetical protein
VPEINLERLEEFCEAWVAKANEADTRHIAGVFDRFFALWIVYNRLYEEAARTLAHEDHPWARRFSRWRNQPFAPPPDRASATQGIVFFCGRRELVAAIAQDDGCRRALEEALCAMDSGLLFLHEDYQTGDPDHDRDRELVERARNDNPEALLALVYQARCNLFHGQKAYSEVQRPLLEGMIAVLVVTIEQARASLRNRARMA